MMLDVYWSVRKIERCVYLAQSLILCILYIGYCSEGYRTTYTACEEVFT